MQLWIAFRFCIFVLWTQSWRFRRYRPTELWIAFRFCIFVLWTQSVTLEYISLLVVNCFQILYIRSLNTIFIFFVTLTHMLWIAFRFCIFVLWTQSTRLFLSEPIGCELLSDFVYSFFEHNLWQHWHFNRLLWIAFRFCIFVLWTQSKATITDTTLCCELLSDFVYSFFEHNHSKGAWQTTCVVNCFQILYIRSLNTIDGSRIKVFIMLWIAFRFCIFVLWTQSDLCRTMRYNDLR